MCPPLSFPQRFYQEGPLDQTSSFAQGMQAFISSRRFPDRVRARGPSDSVFFYAHLSTLSAKSSNNFGGLLPIPSRPNTSRSVANTSTPPPILPADASPGVAPSHDALATPLKTFAVTEDSIVLNILLHIIYSM